tara:strand:- start:437 stop:1024 length:588 start_codon:yes stop_codon:yes gene_type:complete
MDLVALQNLMASGHDSDDDASYGSRKVTPASLFAPPVPSTSSSSSSLTASSSSSRRAAAAAAAMAPTPPAVAPVDANAIWLPEEVLAKHELADVHDARPRPQHEILYKQNLSAQDVYGGLSVGSGMGGGASSARELVVKVHFPGATAKQLDLDVQKKVLIAQSPFHKLKLHLPHEVDKASGRAQVIFYLICVGGD